MCCKDKKYYSELCEKCKLELAQQQRIESDFPHYVEYPNMDPHFTFDKCECGAQSVGAPGHSSWCPMFQARETD